MTYLFEDGRRITYPTSAVRTGELISQIDVEDGRNWGKFSAFAQELMDVTLDTIFSEPSSTLSDMGALIKKNPRFIKFLPTFMTSYQSVLEKYFKKPTVLQTMAYQALYFGLPPALVPGPYAMVPYTEHVGIYYPRGVMIQIPKAIQR
jgi:phytoene dehydrogenase-like protein